MKTLSVFDSNEDITNFVQGKIRVSGMDIVFLDGILNSSTLLFEDESCMEAHCFTGTFQDWQKHTYEYQNQS